MLKKLHIAWLKVTQQVSPSRWKLLNRLSVIRTRSINSFFDSDSNMFSMPIVELHL